VHAALQGSEGYNPGRLAAARPGGEAWVRPVGHGLPGRETGAAPGAAPVESVGPRYLAGVAAGLMLRSSTSKTSVLFGGIGGCPIACPRSP